MTVMKYNPGFLTHDELIESFCVRTHEFESIIEMLRECDSNSNPHRLVIGPRGCGKTSLLRRVAAEIVRDEELSLSLFPVVFSEESYGVANSDEFWLEALYRLAEQAPRLEGDDDLHLTYKELREISDDHTLGKRCLSTLLDFSNRNGKRLVLIVENLNLMFRDIMDAEAGWKLRHTLQTEPSIILLASATSRFDEIDKSDRAFYDLFVCQTLQPLETVECAILWENVTGQHRLPDEMRGLRILTGGSPRLLSIIARFRADLSFRDLMTDLLKLIDDLTEYFKSHIEALPGQERRVYVALADLWEPATAREVATQARLDTNKCSALLNRLIERGAVEVVGGGARRKLYYLAERLYNIYYLLRRSHTQKPLIEALIRFMDAYYSPPELRDVGIRMVREASELEPETETCLQIAELSNKQGQFGETITTISQLFERDINQTSRQHCEGLLIRAHAFVALGDTLQAERDIEQALTLLPDFNNLLGLAINVLLDFTVLQGPQHAKEIIQASPSVEQLVPFTIAIDKELGNEPRVAREIEEVAEDIRRDLEDRQKRND